eukprot:TRINITY_DN1439_c0_g1_i2.p1 TRINITY_DN1439_c0_g1~~TRINITY_DN1439_c0_g1_i2.p1  ORF type:complete len:172 (-),score=58.09 TRINITY_DN1439_c0_g1_i2:60-575(-)
MTTKCMLSFPEPLEGTTRIGEAFAKVLENNKTLQLLYLEECAIGNEGAIEIAQALKTNVTLNNLSLAGNWIQDEGFIALCEPIKENTSLTEINLSNLNITIKSAKAMLEALKLNIGLKQGLDIIELHPFIFEDEDAQVDGSETQLLIAQFQDILVEIGQEIRPNALQVVRS